MTPASLLQAKIKAYDTTSYSRDYTSFFELTEYNRTYELCNEHTVGYHSGNVIKFFSYKMKKPFIVGNRDAYMNKKLEKMRAELNVVEEQTIESEEIISDEVLSDTELSEAELLTADSDSSLLDEPDIIYDDDIVSEISFSENE